jgi:uncharacterized protein YbjT (DUF2867 family)
MRQPLITVFGATGRQGGGVVRALLTQRGRWRVRAVTRRPGSDAALALARLGAELHAADLDDAASLLPALSGAAGAFCVTNFWEHGDAERELRQARHLADAAAASSLRQLIWSTLEDTRRCLPISGCQLPLLQRRFNVPHMDAKGEANALFLARELPVTLLLTSFYWENLIDHGMGPRRAADGHLELVLPLGDALLPGMAAADIGACAAALFAGPPAQRRVGIAGEQLSGAAMALALSERLGEPVRFVDIASADYARLPFPGAAELSRMFAFKQQANAAYCAARPVAATQVLHPGLLDFRAWLQGQPLARLRADLPT